MEILQHLVEIARGIVICTITSLSITALRKILYVTN